MSEIKVSFKNYKLLKEGEVNLSNGSIFFVQGPNNVGKTSFLNLLRAIMEVKDDTENPVSFGEKEGFATGSIVGADGHTYQFRYDFNVDGKNKFQFIADDNRVIKTVTEMRAIFNYTHFTVEEFFDWSKSVPGRKKQRDIFMKLLSDSERVLIEDIDSKINTTNGEFIESRKNLNREVDFLKKRIDATILTPEQKQLHKNADKVTELYTELTVRKKELETTLASTESVEARIVAKNESLNVARDVYNREILNISNRQTAIEIQIEALNKELKACKDNVTDRNKEFQIFKETTTAEVLELTKTVDVNTIEANRKELEAVNVRIVAGQEKKDELVKIATLVEALEKDKKEYEQKSKQAEEFNSKIETLRKQKKETIFNSQNIPSGWSLGDDVITIDDIPFLESDISLSRATKAIAQLMMRINQSPIMLMGDAESLGYEILNELDEQAKAAGKIMIFAEHIREAEELKLVCYDDIEHVAIKKGKELF